MNTSEPVQQAQIKIIQYDDNSSKSDNFELKAKSKFNEFF